MFTPNAELYAKANESALLLRELRRLGPTEVTLDSSRLPALSELDPEGAYLTWRISLEADCDEKAIRDVFEFVEDDCTLEITQLPPPLAMTPGIITGDNGFSFEFFPPVAFEKREEPAAPVPQHRTLRKPRRRPKPGRWR